jgi:hypothetical protein
MARADYRVWAHVVQQLKICAHCGVAVGEAWIEALGRYWHPEHLRCRACGSPISEDSFAIDDGQPIHVRCMQARQPSCAACRRPIEGRHFVDAWGQPFCGIHDGTLSRCLGCGGFVAPAGSSARAPSNIAGWCRRCAAIGVHTEAVLERLFAEVTRWGERIGMRGVSQPITVRFGDEAELAHTRPSAPARRAGFTLWTEQTRRNADGSETAWRTASCVAVIKGAPKPLCQTILVHEMGHVWFCLQNVGNVEGWIEEGFCEYLAHRFNGAFPSPLGGHYRRQIEENDDPIYGEGFRRVHAIARRMSLPQFVADLKADRIRAS